MSTRCEIASAREARLDKIGEYITFNIFGTLTLCAIVAITVLGMSKCTSCEESWDKATIAKLNFDAKKLEDDQQRNNQEHIRRMTMIRYGYTFLSPNHWIAPRDFDAHLETFEGPVKIPD